MNPERITRAQEHHPGDYERYGKYMRSMIEEPDYIVETDRPKTAFILKTFVENECQFRLILRLHTADDDPNFENSVITPPNMCGQKNIGGFCAEQKVLYKRLDL